MCFGCGATPDELEPYPFRCPNADVGDVDHVLVRRLEAGRVSFPAVASRAESPFVTFRGLLHSSHRARANGMEDDEFVELVTVLDDEVAGVAGIGFRPTPFERNACLSDRLRFSAAGGVWVKDETGNVSGSHKGRHLMGVMLHLVLAEQLGLADAGARPDLAIASCGNAALAAAVIARAAARRLRVFVPEGADPVVLSGLRELGADVVACPRTPGVPGDPAYARLRADVAAGAIPFTCQGSSNGLVVEGGETLAYEIASDLRTEGVTLDHLVVQVGGGALASACVQGFDEAVSLGVLSSGPRIHTVQTSGGHPLERAYARVREVLASAPSASDIDAALHQAARNRSAFMWPWEPEPSSMATGILDDETYDWRAVVAGMLGSGGRPLVVSEDSLARAHHLGHSAGYQVDPTGSAGLAGLLDLVADGVIAADDRVAVLFTGVDRQVGTIGP